MNASERAGAWDSGREIRSEAVALASDLERYGITVDVRFPRTYGDDRAVLHFPGKSIRSMSQMGALMTLTCIMEAVR